MSLWGLVLAPLVLPSDHVHFFLTLKSHKEPPFSSRAGRICGEGDQEIAVKPTDFVAGGVGGMFTVIVGHLFGLVNVWL